MTPFRHAARALIGVTVFVVAGCGSSPKNAPTSTSASSGEAGSVSVVAIGDSDATGIGDPSGGGWVGRYGELVQRRLGLPVAVDNEAAEGKTSDQLRHEVTSDQALRQTLGDADIVLIGIGGADLNAGDASLQANLCAGRACYAPVLARFGRNIAAIAAEVRRITSTALLRAMSLPNGYPGAGSAYPPSATADVSRYQATTERDLVCRAMQSNGGQCVDVVRAFNGASASANAYKTGLMTKNPCCYPSGAGQQLIARLLVRTGLGGLTSAGQSATPSP